MIAFLHTSEIHITKFENLVRIFNKDVEIKHFVNTDILSYALENGKTDDKTFEIEVALIKEFNPELIICTCSTYGASCDKNNYIERIDKPIAEYLIANYTNIGLAFTATSTQVVSRDLLLSIAKEYNKSVKIIDCDCSEAWKYYETNDFATYEKTIAENLKKFEDRVEVLYLAQASMEGAMKYLLDFTKEIHSSPAFGIEKYLK